MKMELSEYLLIMLKILLQVFWYDLAVIQMQAQSHNYSKQKHRTFVPQGICHPNEGLGYHYVDGLFHPN